MQHSLALDVAPQRLSLAVSGRNTRLIIVAGVAVIYLLRRKS